MVILTSLKTHFYLLAVTQMLMKFCFKHVLTMFYFVLSHTTSAVCIAQCVLETLSETRHQDFDDLHADRGVSENWITKIKAVWFFKVSKSFSQNTYYLYPFMKGV